MQTLRLISSMATRELVADMVALYEKQSGLVVAAQAAGGVEVAKRLRAGELTDVVILARDAIDKLEADGIVIPDSGIDLVRSAIGVAVKLGAEVPRIDSEDAVKSAVQSAVSISYSTGPSGVHLEKLFARWGILETVRSRIVVPPPGTPVAQLVASGEAQLGFQQLSELLNAPGVRVPGPLPRSIQSLTVFSGGIVAGCARVPAARALLQFMASPTMQDLKHRQGMESV